MSTTGGSSSRMMGYSSSGGSVTASMGGRTPTANTSSGYNHHHGDRSQSHSHSIESMSTTTSWSHQQLDELSQALQLSVGLADRKCSKTRQRYKACFVGSDAVDILQGLCKTSSRQDALHVGRLLQQHLSLFECVNSPNVTRLEDDGRLFYHFTHSTVGSTRGKLEALLVNLDEKMRVFQRGVKVKDRSYRLGNYKQSFVGKEAVDLMMRHKMAPTRADCVELGRILQRRYNLFVPMQGGEFEDDAYKFYRLLLPQKEKAKQPSFLEEIKPARVWIALSLIPACLIYYYFY